MKARAIIAITAWFSTPLSPYTVKSRHDTDGKPIWRWNACSDSSPMSLAQPYMWSESYGGPTISSVRYSSLEMSCWM